jgi:hypothetical protein
MKVEGSGRSRGGTSVRRAGKSDKNDKTSFAREVSADEEVSSVSGISTTSPLAGVTGVLALQEVDDATARASKGKQRAQEMLEKLDEIRLALLAGELTADRIVGLARVVQSRRAQVDDPRLAEVLDEIDLRAQVELAKLTPNRS